jgi:hypothetical protein
MKRVSTVVMNNEEFSNLTDGVPSLNKILLNNYD